MFSLCSFFLLIFLNDYKLFSITVTTLTDDRGRKETWIRGAGAKNMKSGVLPQHMTSPHDPLARERRGAEHAALGTLM
jgi:hypothetical protein